MKKCYLFFLLILLAFQSRATIWNVNVANFSFSPSVVNAVVGDVIHFVWVSGNHTTTCGGSLVGTSIPPGALPWNSNINTVTRTFDYTVTVPGSYFYGCVPHFGGGLGMAATIVVSDPVPVQLGQFNASFRDKQTLLLWETRSELNTHHFSIRRSHDGTHFTEIGTLPAAGNSNRLLQYQWNDLQPGDEFRYLYYDIVTVDLDGKEQHSPIRLVKNSLATKGNLIVSVGPNPITRPGQARVLFNADKRGQMDVKLINAQGQVVLRTQMAAFVGLNNAHLHVCNLAAGTYLIEFNLDGKKETQSLVVF